MTSNSSSELIILQDDYILPDELIAGKCLSLMFDEVGKFIKNDNINLLDIEQLCIEIADKHNCSFTFKNYSKGGVNSFPSSFCTSISNSESSVLVHGIIKDYILKPGNILKVDIGLTYNKKIVDACRTFIYKSPLNQRHVDLVNTTKEALKRAISVIKIGAQIGVIGNCISKYVKSQGFGLVSDYGGHGISLGAKTLGLDINGFKTKEGQLEPHSQPFVSNKANSNEGIRIMPGMLFAIEPLLVIGEPRTWVDKNGWDVYTTGYSAHEEDTIYIDKDGKVINITGGYEI